MESMTSPAFPSNVVERTVTVNCTSILSPTFALRASSAWQAAGAKMVEISSGWSPEEKAKQKAAKRQAASSLYDGIVDEPGKQLHQRSGGRGSSEEVARPRHETKHGQPKNTPPKTASAKSCVFRDFGVSNFRFGE